MSNAMTLRLDIWADDGKDLPEHRGELAELFAPHLEHVAAQCEAGTIAGELIGDDFSGWWAIEETKPDNSELVKALKLAWSLLPARSPADPVMADYEQIRVVLASVQP